MFDILSLSTAVHTASFPASVHLFPTSLRSGFKVCLFQSRGGLKLAGRCSAAELVRWKPLLKTSGRAWGGCWHSGACPHAVLSICPCPVPRGGGGQTPGEPILHETQIMPDEERWSLAKYSYPPHLSIKKSLSNLGFTKESIQISECEYCSFSYAMCVEQFIFQAFLILERPKCIYSFLITNIFSLDAFSFVIFLHFKVSFYEQFIGKHH